MDLREKRESARVFEGSLNRLSAIILNKSRSRFIVGDEKTERGVVEILALDMRDEGFTSYK